MSRMAVRPEHTVELITDHFCGSEVEGYEKWLLYKARDVRKIDGRICRLWHALDCSPEEALQAIQSFMKGKFPIAGKNIPGTRLKVFKALDGETYGDNACYVAFGLERPKLSAQDTFLGVRWTRS